MAASEEKTRRIDKNKERGRGRRKKKRGEEPVLGGSLAAAIKNLFDDPSVPVASRSWKKDGEDRQ